MACEPTGSSQKRVCVGDCFDVDERGRLELKFSSGMDNLFVCTDDGLCYSHEYPVTADTRIEGTGCGYNENCEEGDDPWFLGAGEFGGSTPGPYQTDNSNVRDNCSPTLDESINLEIAPANRLLLTNDSCQTWSVRVTTDQFYGFVDDFQPFKAGYARVIGTVEFEIDGIPVTVQPQRVYELARSGQTGAVVDDACLDCCNDLPADDGNGGNPRQDCIDNVNANSEQAQAVIRLLTFRDRLNTTGGGYSTFITLQPGEVLEAKTEIRGTRTCEQDQAVLGGRAGHITMEAWPVVGCSDNSACDECPDCTNC